LNRTGINYDDRVIKKTKANKYSLATQSSLSDFFGLSPDKKENEDNENQNIHVLDIEEG
jgi:hypothetical protein